MERAEAVGAHFPAGCAQGGPCRMQGVVLELHHLLLVRLLGAPRLQGRQWDMAVMDGVFIML